MYPKENEKTKGRVESRVYYCAWTEFIQLLVDLKTIRIRRPPVSITQRSELQQNSGAAFVITSVLSITHAPLDFWPLLYVSTLTYLATSRCVCVCTDRERRKQWLLNTWGWIMKQKRTGWPSQRTICSSTSPISLQSRRSVSTRYELVANSSIKIHTWAILPAQHTVNRI